MSGSGLVYPRFHTQSYLLAPSYGDFQGTRETRQRDPLSPYLFIWMVDFLFLID